MSECECGFEVGNSVSFAGGTGEVALVNHRSGGQCLLTVLTEDGQQKRPAAIVDKVQSIKSKLTAQDFDIPDEFDLRTLAAELDLVHRRDRFVALGGSRIDIEPYQVQAAHEILDSYDHRYLIGDEVGLGKTIEAAIVLEELISRGRADRVLIVAPAPLTVQWQQEMQDKFDRDYVIYDREYVRARRKASPNQNVWTQDDRIITSIDFAKQEDMRSALDNLDEDWDIAVFDESHHLTARRRSDDAVERTERYKLGEVVARTSDGLVFLTGTPHKGKTDQFYFMISLLDPYRFRDEYDITPEKLDDLMIRRLKTDMFAEDGTKMFPEKNIETLPVTLTKQERRLYEDITEYISEFYNLASREESQVAGFAMVIYQKRLVSSIHAIRMSLKNRMESIKAGGANPSDLSDLVRSLLDQYRDDPEMLTDAQRQRVEKELEGLAISDDPELIQEEYQMVQELYNQAKRIDVDSKAEQLQAYVDGILDGDPEEKILIFTEYTDTLEYLRDRIFSNEDLATIYGDLNQGQRRAEISKFEEDANILLATDAAREGLNLQFAHIMVNYDLPWNPTRIDQRIGRLHRYGQDRTVEIQNLFIDNTREADILELLFEKVEEIENTLGVSSDVLGTVLEDVDLEGQIMSALSDGDSAEAIRSQLNETINERKDAVERIENDFLIRDRFDLEDEDQDVMDLIEDSREETVSEEDIETLVRTFCGVYDGRIVNVHPGPAEDGGDVFDLVTPERITGTDVEQRYNESTFDRRNAVEDEQITFIAIDHPVVQSMVDFCLDSDRGDGQTAVKTGGANLELPGLVCNYRLGYLSGTGDTVTERLARVYVSHDGEVHMDEMNLTGGLPPSMAQGQQGMDLVTDRTESLVEVAENAAWQYLQEFSGEARERREREVSIKQEHAERYFETRVEEIEERIDRLRSRQQNGNEDMRAPIGQAKRQLEDIRHERQEEFARLEEDEQVIPEEPELVTAAVVVGAFDD